MATGIDRQTWEDALAFVTLHGERAPARLLMHMIAAALEDDEEEVLRLCEIGQVLESVLHPGAVQ